MASVYLCDVDRAGLAVALAIRGLAVLPITRHQLVREEQDRHAALLIGWRRGDRPVEVLTRRWPGPLMVLMARGGEAEAVRALDGGADSAMFDRVGNDLIAARLAAMLRRDRGMPILRLGELAIDPVERRVTRAGRAIDLLPREYALLLHLAQRAGAVVDRAALREAVWGLEFDPGTNVIEVHVSRLRAKLDRGFAAPMLLTEKGRGYRLVAGVQSPIAAGAHAV